MPDFADEPTTELQRKARALMWVALAETLSYAVLAWFWLTGHEAGTAVTGTIHGLIWMGFVAMVVMIARPIGWSWWYAAAVIVTGPIGALMVFARIRRDGVPEQYGQGATPGARRPV